MDIERNIIYGMYSGLALLTDVYHSTDAKGRGIVFIAGSGWTAPLGLDAMPLKDSGQAAIWAEPLAAAGYTVFAISHRAVPRFRYPAPVKDAQRAVRYMRHHAERYGIDPKKIGAMGGSSGGHLASMLGVLDGAGDPQDADPIQRLSAKAQCVVARAAPQDLTLLQREGFLGCRYSDVEGSPENRVHRDASPLYNLTSDAAPFLLVHGDADPVVPVEHSQLMHQALKKLGVPAELLIVPGGGHGPRFGDPPDAPDYIGAAIAHFDRYLA